MPFVKKIYALLGLLRSYLIYNILPLDISRMRKLYQQFIWPGSVCFDIGAHTGSRTALWLKMDAKVIAVEPQPLFSRLLQKRFNRYESFTLLREAVGKEEGRTRLRISSLYPTVSTVSEEWTEAITGISPSVRWDDSVEVKKTTLDEMIKTFGVPDFCKIDVEGFEEEVLAGLSYPIPALSFEFFPATFRRSSLCIDLLMSLGNYQFNWSVAESFYLQSPEWLDADAIKKAIASYQGKKAGDVYAVLNPPQLYRHRS